MVDVHNQFHHQVILANKILVLLTEDPVLAVVVDAPRLARQIRATVVAVINQFHHRVILTNKRLVHRTEDLVLVVAVDALWLVHQIPVVLVDAINQFHLQDSKVGDHKVMGLRLVHVDLV